jgi:hypothetical protein
MSKDRFNYKKKDIVKSGRVLHSGGPRDLQRKQNSNNVDSDAIVEALKLQILNLKNELNVSSGYTQEELETEIRKSAKSIEKKYKDDIANVSEIKVELDKTKLELKTSYDDVNILQTNLKLSQEKLNSIESTLVIKNEKIRDLEERVKEQKEIISLLKHRPVTLEGAGLVEEQSDRPKLQDVFIDPISAASENGLKSHVDVSSISSKEKESNKDKVNKLKSLMKGPLK